MVNINVLAFLETIQPQSPYKFRTLSLSHTSFHGDAVIAGRRHSAQQKGCVCVEICLSLHRLAFKRHDVVGICIPHGRLSATRCAPSCCANNITTRTTQQSSTRNTHHATHKTQHSSTLMTDEVSSSIRPGPWTPGVCDEVHEDV